MSISPSKSPVLVTGATGNVGKHVVSLLAAAGVPVHAVSRNADASSGSALITPVQADLASPSSLLGALEGVESVFLMMRAFSAPIAPLMDLLKQRVTRIVFLSSSAIDDNQTQQTNPIGKVHLEIEDEIRQSISAWTFLRPGAFAANAINWWAPQLVQADTMRWPFAEATTAPIHERDIAAVAARALLDGGHQGKKYFLTGGESLTQRRQVELTGSATGRELRFEEITADEAGKQLSAFMPPFVIDRLLQMWSASVGRPAFITDTVKQVTGSEPATFAQWAAEHSAEFALGAQGGDR